jgi:hypothetical protein
LRPIVPRISTATDDGGMANPPSAVLVDHVGDGRGQDDDDRQIDRIVHFSDGRVASAARDLHCPGVDGVDGATIVAFDQFSETTPKPNMWGSLEAPMTATPRGSRTGSSMGLYYKVFSECGEKASTPRLKRARSYVARALP